jgi:hypothetical protein
VANTIDDYLEQLKPWIEPWALMTQAEREAKRRQSSSGEMQAFYDAMVPRMEGIIESLNSYRLDELSAEARTLTNLTLSLAEIAPHVEFYGGAAGVPYAFAEERFVAERAHWTEL